MKFGIRQVANLTLRSKAEQYIGNTLFHAGQPVLYIDTATTSSLEQAATTVYAQGGRGNARLIAWEGDKTLTLTFTDALLSPVGLAVLSGAGLFHGGEPKTVHYHMSSMASVGTDGIIDISDAIAEFGVDDTSKTYVAKFCATDAPVYVMEVEEDGSLTGKTLETGKLTVTETAGTDPVDENPPKTTITLATKPAAATNVMIDYYVDLPSETVYEADITTDEFAGYYYVEGDVLVRRQDNGKDMPGNLTIPNAKLQSNFTITMASTGDPSTFDFTLDAFPGYTYFDKTKKVLAVVQIVDSSKASLKKGKPVMPHTDVVEHTDIFENASNKDVVAPVEP